MAKQIIFIKSTTELNAFINAESIGKIKKLLRTSIKCGIFHKQPL